MKEYKVAVLGATGAAVSGFAGKGAGQRPQRGQARIFRGRNAAD